MVGGAGNDMFRDTAGLNGDTITDFAAGDRIVITDANLAGFTFNLTGNTLTYTGGSLTLQGRHRPAVGLGGGRRRRPADAPGVAAINDVRNDFNGDGRSDILWRNDNGTLTDWLGQANGGFADNDANAFAACARPAGTIAGTGDFNGDGRDDILWRNDNGQLTNWLGQANGGFVGNDAQCLHQRPDQTGTSPAPATSTATAATTSCGATTAARSPTGSARPMAGSPTTTPMPSPASRPTGTSPAPATSTATAATTSCGATTPAQLTNWLGTANGGFADNDANALHAAVPTNWHIAGTGDFNGDGRDDILWRNDAGQLTNWLGTGQWRVRRQRRQCLHQRADQLAGRRHRRLQRRRPRRHPVAQRQRPAHQLARHADGGFADNWNARPQLSNQLAGAAGGSVDLGGRNVRFPPKADVRARAYLYIPARKLMPCSSHALSAHSIWLQPWQLP